MKNLNYPKIIEIITIDLVFVGSKKVNFKILKMLPTSVDEIMRETGLTEVPVNNRLNELEKYLLVKRSRGTGLVYEGLMTKYFMDLYKKLEKHIENNTGNYIFLAIK